jgi:hypothetical protein
VLPLEAPSKLHFTHRRGGGYQIISIMIGALGRWFCTLQYFRIQKSFISWPDDNAVRLADKEALEIIIEITFLQPIKKILTKK